MYRFVICDDDPEIIRTVEKYLDLYSRETGEQIKLFSFSSGSSMLASYPPDADLVFLDIALGDENGINIAKKLRKIAPDVCLIFITTMAQYALEGYSVRAFGFLPKPLSYQVVRQELNSAMKLLKQQARHFILIKDQESGIQKQIDVREIYYLEVQKHTITVVTENEKVRTRGQIGAFIDELSEYGFLRCHLSYLVNYKYISNVGMTDLILSDGTIIPISRNRRKSFVSELTTFVGRMI